MTTTKADLYNQSKYMDKEEQLSIAEQFQTDVDTAKIQQMAEFIAIEDNAVSELSTQLVDRKKNLDQLKADLATLMMQSGMNSVKLDNGLTPSASVKTTYFKSAGVSDEQLFSWLKDNHLDGIIKPTVPWNTLDSTLKAYADSGNEVPELFNKVDKPTVRMNGKSKFLASRQT